MIARYQSEVDIGLQLVLRGELDAAERLVDDVTSAAARLELREIHQFMLVLRAILAGHRRDRAGMEAARAKLAALGGDQNQHSARLHGLAATFCALLEEDRERADLAVALAAERATPTTFLPTGRLGMGLLVRALDGELTAAEYAETVASPAAGLRWDRHFVRLAAAVLAGADGDEAAAAAHVAAAQEAARSTRSPATWGYAWSARRQCTTGGGDPEVWLRTAEQYFHAAAPAVAGACRAQLRKLGVRVAQRRTGVHEVPHRLRLAGVTSREYGWRGLDTARGEHVVRRWRADRGGGAHQRGRRPCAHRGRAGECAAVRWPGFHGRTHDQQRSATILGTLTPDHGSAPDDRHYVRRGER